MPIYTTHCMNGHRTEQYITLSEYERLRNLNFTCSCGAAATVVITAPIMVKAQPECRYDSPIDGTPITSWAARRNDLAKHGCSPYDPDQKTDYHQRIKDADAAMEKAVDEHVERSVEKMSGAQRGKLWSELVDKGVTADVTRSTYSGS